MTLNTPEEWKLVRDEIGRFFDQVVADLKSAHEKICELQNLNPEFHSWPEWSPQANTLRWIPKLRAILAAAPSLPPISGSADELKHKLAAIEALYDACMAPWHVNPAKSPRDVRLKREHWEIGQPFGKGVGIIFGDDITQAKLIVELFNAWPLIRAALASPTYGEGIEAVVEAAQELVGLWENQKIAGLPRADRNAAIDDTRNKLIAAIRALAPKAGTSEDNNDIILVIDRVLQDYGTDRRLHAVLHRARSEIVKLRIKPTGQELEP